MTSCNTILFFSLLATTTNVFAQTTTLQLPFYGYDEQNIEASIVAVSNQVTTMALACPTGTDANDCGLFPYQTLTVGPSTYNMFMSAPQNAFIGTQDCSGSVCMESASGSEANFPGSSTTTYDTTAILPVAVTAGASLLSGGSGGAGPTTRASVSQTTASLTQLTGTASPTPTGSATESTTSNSSSGAASRVGGKTGGIAAAVVGCYLFC